MSRRKASVIFAPGMGSGVEASPSGGTAASMPASSAAAVAGPVQDRSQSMRKLSVVLGADVAAIASTRPMSKGADRTDIVGMLPQDLVDGPMGRPSSSSLLPRLRRGVTSPSLVGKTSPLAGKRGGRKRPRSEQSGGAAGTRRRSKMAWLTAEGTPRQSVLSRPDDVSHHRPLSRDSAGSRPRSRSPQDRRHRRPSAYNAELLAQPPRPGTASSTTSVASSGLLTTGSLPRPERGRNFGREAGPVGMGSRSGVTTRPVAGGRRRSVSPVRRPDSPLADLELRRRRAGEEFEDRTVLGGALGLGGGQWEAQGLPAEMVASTKRIHKELADTLAAKHKQGRRMGLLLELGRSALPLSFLAAHNQLAEAKYRAAALISRVAGRLFSAQLGAAWRQWIGVVLVARRAEHQAELQRLGKLKGGKRIMAVLEGLCLQRVEARFRHWQRLVKRSQHTDQVKAALMIQKSFRGAQGWASAARAMRKKKKKRAADRRMVLKAMYFEWFLKHAHRATREHIILVRLENAAAVRMQTHWRGRIARKERRARAWAQRMRLDREHLERQSVLAMQRAWRCKVARRELFQRRDAKKAADGERAVARALARMRNRLIATVYQSWALWAYRTVRCRAIFLRIRNRELWTVLVEWHRRAAGEAGARRMLARLMSRSKRFSMERWRAHTAYVREVKRLDGIERRRVECERIVKNCILRMRHRTLAQSTAAWRHFAKSRRGARRMLQRVLQRLQARCLSGWTQFVEMQKNERDQRRASNERKVAAALKRLRHRMVALCFDGLHMYRVRMLGVKRMVARYLGRLTASMYMRWVAYTKDWRAQHAANEAKAGAVLFRMLMREVHMCFNNWALYRRRSLHVKSMIRRRLGQTKRANFDAWAVQAMLQRVGAALKKLEGIMAGYRGLSVMPVNLVERTRRIMAEAPQDLASPDVVALRNAATALLQWEAKEEQMALRVQCAWRVRTGRLVMQLKRQARKERVQQEADDLRTSNAAALKIQRRFRGLEGRRAFLDLKEVRRKDALRAKYLEERRVAQEREKWARELEEEAFRKKVRRELEEKLAEERRVEALKKKEHQARVDAAWEEVPDGFGGVYYYNEVSGASQTTRPDAFTTNLGVAGIPPSLRLSAEEQERAVVALATTDMVDDAVRGEALEALEPAVSRVEFSAVYLMVLRGKDDNDFAGAATAARVNAKQSLEAPDKALLQQTLRRSPVLDDDTKNEAELALRCCTTKAETHALLYALVRRLPTDQLWREMTRARVALAALKSPWQVHRDPGGRPYFYHSRTGETVWEKPPPEPHPTAADGMCERCRREKATRDCHDCRFSYCFGCFAMVHHRGAPPPMDAAGHVDPDDPTQHHVTPVKYRLPAPFGCHVCAQELATHECHQCEETHYCETCFWDAHARGPMADHAYTKFIAGSAVCLECEEKLADKHCEQCKDNMCEACARKTHAKGRKALHTWADVFFVEKDELGDDDEYCSECQQRKASRVCDQCGDNYCDACYRRTHQKGRRLQHTYQTWGQAQTDWEEFWDESKNKYVYYNPVTKESSETKPVELLWGKEKQQYLDNKAAEEKEKWETSELKRLQDRVAVLEMRNKELGTKKPGLLDRAKGAARRGIRRVSQAVAPSMFTEDAAGGAKAGGGEAKGDEADGAGGEKDEKDEEDEDEDEEGEDEDEGEDEETQLRKQQIERKRRMLRMVKPNSTLMQEAKKNPRSFASNPVRFYKDFKYLKREQDARYLRKMMIGKEKDADEKVKERKKFEKALLEELSGKQDEKRKVMFKDLLQEKKEHGKPKVEEKAWHEDLLAE